VWVVRAPAAHCASVPRKSRPRSLPVETRALIYCDYLLAAAACIA